MARAGAEVPGYTGHIPGKRPEAHVVGSTFRAANDKVATGEAHEPCKAWNSGSAAAWSPRAWNPTSPQAWSPRRADGAVPGYKGHIPGKVEDVYGATYRNAGLHASGEVGATELGRLRPHETVVRGAFAPPPRQGAQGAGTARATAAVPHYTGHIPGKVSEMVVGRTEKAANARAASEFEVAIGKKDATRSHWRRPSGPGVASRRGSWAAPGMAVPGYTGHIPGKGPESHMIGGTFAMQNTEAVQARRQKQLEKPKRGSGGSAASTMSVVSASSAGRRAPGARSRTDANAEEW
eukprot:CAMPEP_0180439736 /NCGR_PEP_ID=MMETSP1036_2-20121128/12743_1 /TAXON_ID=632150 /ORGANISM="Azadinium spinosum, Strain 3D9" /LENGTH=292 /DNA_ID=CAMNT_0022445887 /DNA_START=48 /DNA_END=923 /DNA_ORIENTATION=+